MNFLSKLTCGNKKFTSSRASLGQPVIINGQKAYNIKSLPEVMKIPTTLATLNASGLKIMNANTLVKSSQSFRFVRTSDLPQHLANKSQEMLGKSSICAAVNSYLRTREQKPEFLNSLPLDASSLVGSFKHANGMIKCEEQDQDLDDMPMEELAALSKYRRAKLEAKKEEKLLKNMQ
jgi:hypothetical protein